MFKQRLITTLLLIPLVLLILFYVPYFIWISLLTVVIAICGLEWMQFIPLKKTAFKALFVIGLLLLTALIYSLPLSWFHYWVVVGLFVWILIIIAEISYPRSQAFWGYSVSIGFLAYLLLPLFFQSLTQIYLFPRGKILFLYLLCIVWAADIGGYLTGKQWGKHKLIPLVSPGKSWEGVLGGMLLTSLVAYLGFVYFKPTNSLAWFALAGCLFVISIAGDLFISMLKRRVGLKDTGTLIPGHGGFLDRLDSLIAASPLFYFGIINCAAGL